MTFPFDPTTGAVVVVGALLGPIKTVELRLLLDTGADISVIDPGSMVASGYDLSKSLGQIDVTTAGTTGTTADLFRVARLSSLGLSRDNFPILCYGLPPNVHIDGLLGLDFFADHVLTLDIVNHTVSLT